MNLHWMPSHMFMFLDDAVLSCVNSVSIVVMYLFSVVVVDLILFLSLSYIMVNNKKHKYDSLLVTLFSLTSRPTPYSDLLL